MLGIDYNDNKFRVVWLKGKGAGLELREAFKLECNSGNPAELGEMLHDELEQRNLHRQSAVMVLPDNLGFVRKYNIPGNANKKEEINRLLEHTKNSIGLNSDELVLDYLIRPGTEPESLMVLIAACPREHIEFCKAIALQARLKLDSILLRSMACVNGLAGNWDTTESEKVAVVYHQKQQCTVAMMDKQGLLWLQTAGVNDDDIVRGLSNAVPTVFNTMKLSGESFWPELLLLCSSQADNKTLDLSSQRLSEKLGVLTQLCYEPGGLTWGQKPEQLNNYVAAIGGALEGLHLAVASFDMLHPRGKKPEKKKHHSWKPAITGIVVALVLAGVFWLSLLEQKNARLAELKNEIVPLQLELEEIKAARDNFNLFGSYLPAVREGNRISYLRILYEINMLFPETTDAYITSFQIGRVTGSNEYEIKISGRVREGDIVNTFIESLNGSSYFQDAKQAGPVIREAGDEFYPSRFSVTCILRRLVR